MAELEIVLGNDLVEGIKRLALVHYGDGGETSVGRVVECALEMRLLWLRLIEEAGKEVNEPITNWETEDALASEEGQARVRDWLFRRKEP